MPVGADDLNFTTVTLLVAKQFLAVLLANVSASGTEDSENT